MPELVVSMPACNTGDYVGIAAQSVLSQENVDLELVVVDDGSGDNTREVVRSLDDRRVRLLENKQKLGIACCHNLVRRSSDSRFIAHVDSDDILLPGALARMVESFREDGAIPYAHCNYELIGASGELLTHGRLRERQKYLRERTPEMDHKRELLLRGGEAANHLRTYLRSVFDTVGDFDEKLPSGGEDYDMALRIADRFDIRLVPEVLYKYRIHPRSATGPFYIPSISFLISRWRICSRLMANRRISFTSRPDYPPRRLMLQGFFRQALGVAFGGCR